MGHGVNWHLVRAHRPCVLAAVCRTGGRDSGWFLPRGPDPSLWVPRSPHQSVMLVCMSLLCQYHPVLMTVALWQVLKSKSMNLSTLYFFKIVLVSLDPLKFLMNFVICLSVSTQKLPGILVGTVLGLWAAWVVLALPLLRHLPSSDPGALRKRELVGLHPWCSSVAPYPLQNKAQTP